MFSKFKNNEKVIVCGFGEECGKFYKNKLAIIIQQDPYYKDYLVRFENGNEDWILSKYIKKPYQDERK